MNQAMDLVGNCATLTLATTNEGGEPHCSYAPFVRPENDGFYVLISALAQHTANLKQQRRASVLIIEDEQSAEDIFARRRLSLDCSAKFIDRTTPQWAVVVDELKHRHGETVELLRELPDFSLVCLVPDAGTLVTGFAQATPLNADNSPLIRPRG